MLLSVAGSGPDDRSPVIPYTTFCGYTLSLLVRQVPELIDFFHFSSLHLQKSDHKINGTLVGGIQRTADGMDDIFE